MRFIFFILITLACVPVQATDLKDGQSFVLINLDTNSIRNIRFKAIDSKKRFRAKSYSGNKKKVKAGIYYLEEMSSIYSNIQPSRLKERTSDNGKFVISPNTVTYLGDWKIGTEFGGQHEYDGRIEFDMTSLKKYLKKYPYLKDYQLQIATDKGTVKQLDWNEI